MAAGNAEPHVRGVGAETGSGAVSIEACCSSQVATQLANWLPGTSVLAILVAVSHRGHRVPVGRGSDGFGTVLPLGSGAEQGPHGRRCYYSGGVTAQWTRRSRRSTSEAMRPQWPGTDNGSLSTDSVPCVLPIRLVQRENYPHYNDPNLPGG